MKDVARRAGVSISTVSSVINGTKRVSDELTLKVTESVDALGYRVDPIARSLKNKKSRLIGVVMSNITSIFFPQVLKGIDDEAYKHGYNLMFFDSGNDLKRERSCIQTLADYNIEGLIIDTVADEGRNPEYIKYLKDRFSQKKPVVSIEKDLDGESIGSVLIDNEESSYRAVKHLTEFGHRKIAHIGAAPEVCSLIHKRHSGYARAVSEISGKEIYSQAENYNSLAGYAAMRRLLMNGQEFTAVFAGNDQLAIGAIHALKEHNIRVPDDVAMVGFDDIPIASLITPSLTTVSVPRYSMGSAAMNKIIAILDNGNIQNNEIPYKTILPTRLTVRQSTDKGANTAWDLYGW